MNHKVLLAAAALLASAAPASAARTFNFSYSGVITAGAGVGTTVNGSGTFTTTDSTTVVNGRNALTVTGITGQRNGVAITGLAPAFPDDFGGADSYLFTSGVPVTDLGISFSLANGTYANIFDDAGAPEEFAAADILGEANRSNAPNLTFRLSEVTGGVPEPATWALMLGGFGLAGVAMRKRTRTTVTYA